MAKTLSLQELLVDGAKLGLSHALSIIGALLLFLLTFWIPYINIGTTVAIFSLPVKLQEKKPFSPTYIFDPSYRKRFGESALILALFSMGLLFAALIGIYTFTLIMPVLVAVLGKTFAAGGMMGDYGMRGGMEFEGMRQLGMMGGIFLPTMFAIILTPVVVLQTSWALSYFLLIDKNLAPMEALQASSAAMEGQKGSFFLADVIVAVGAILIMMILGYFLDMIPMTFQLSLITSFLLMVVTFLVIAIYKMGICGTLYHARKDK